MKQIVKISLLFAAMLTLLTSCPSPLNPSGVSDPNSSAGSGGETGSQSNMIELVHDLDMGGGLSAVLTMQVEFVKDTGIVYDSGSDPSVIDMQQYELRIGGSIVTSGNETITFWGDGQYLEMTNGSYLTGGTLSVLPHFFRMTFYTDTNNENWLVTDQYDVRVQNGGFAFKIGERRSWRYL